MRQTVRTASVHLAVAATLVLATAVTTHAQALVPAQGEGLVSIQFANTVSKDHFLLDERYDRGRTDTHAMLFDFTYGLTDRVAVSVGLPVNVSRYHGIFGHKLPSGAIPLDDGAWHTSTQDFRFALRYNAVRGPIVLTPFISTNLPSYGYEFYAHSAPGPRVKELHGGLAAARLFADLGLAVQGRYSLAFSEEVLEVVPSRRYSVAMLEVAYFLRPSVRVMAMTSSRIGHNGIDLPPDVASLPFEVFYHHDRISRESILNVGGGLGVSLSDTWDLFGSYTTTVRGRNTHAVNRGINLGVTWSFTRGGAAALPSVRDTREGALVKCLCQKAS